MYVILIWSQWFTNSQNKPTILHLLYCSKQRMVQYLDHSVKESRNKHFSSVTIHYIPLNMANKQKLNFILLRIQHQKYHQFKFSKQNIYNMVQESWESAVSICQQSQQIQTFQVECIITLIGEKLWMKKKKIKYLWVKFNFIELNLNKIIDWPRQKNNLRWNDFKIMLLNLLFNQYFFQKYFLLSFNLSLFLKR